jgi:hypothetical protein
MTIKKKPVDTTEDFSNERYDHLLQFYVEKKNQIKEESLYNLCLYLNYSSLQCIYLIKDESKTPKAKFHQGHLVRIHQIFLTLEILENESTLIAYNYSDVRLLRSRPFFVDEVFNHELSHIYQAVSEKW